eukprot:CAMPEP_0184304398 /NCGR_PEP_ID=MMETSP1049-20130417/13924_1 /TAXON_ID=77928 /ORGANISM="Proteomonas sulcata, Strain CCMP704" /LENGTH=220 /DNA_ID=CAMNT_0026616195 /DNA_START=120 /DNA_END=779 /DNA_ORIENTATION=+
MKANLTQVAISAEMGLRGLPFAFLNGKPTEQELQAIQLQVDIFTGKVAAPTTPPPTPPPSDDSASVNAGAVVGGLFGGLFFVWLIRLVYLKRYEIQNLKLTDLKPAPIKLEDLKPAVLVPKLKAMLRRQWDTMKATLRRHWDTLKTRVAPSELVEEADPEESMTPSPLTAQTLSRRSSMDQRDSLKENYEMDSPDPDASFNSSSRLVVPESPQNAQEAGW